MTFMQSLAFQPIYQPGKATAAKVHRLRQLEHLHPTVLSQA